MKFEIEINLNDQEKEQLAQILECDDKDLEESFKPYCEAASLEQLRMILGQRVFTRGSDFREYRLFLLIIHAFDNDIPSEQKVSDLFQTTITQSRSLIRSVMSKYQYELDKAIKDTIKNKLSEAKPSKSKSEHKYIVAIDNKSIVEQINRELGKIDGELTRMKKVRNSVSTYEIEPASIQDLADKLGVKIEEIEEED